MKADSHKKTSKKIVSVGPDFFEDTWKQSWTYIRTVVDVVREPIVILDKNFKVLAANEPFYKTFHVKPKETEGRLIYELGNGQWNIPSLRKLIENILPKHTFFKGFEVAHDFPSIGRKVMILNARQIHFSGKNETLTFPPIILLAIEDISEMMMVAKTLVENTNRLEAKMASRTHELEVYISKLEKDLTKLRKSSSASKKK
jgi:hypothetical protein